jgi:hypothetical protein
MRKSFIFILALVITTQLLAQKSFKRNTAYAEILGNGMRLSANYEYQLSSKPGFGLHIGIGLGGYNPAIPFGVKYLIDLGNKKSFVETGTGVTLAERGMWDEKQQNQDRNPYQPGFIPSVGYRHHTHYGLMWKLIYSPFVTKGRKEWNFWGVAIGWRF